METLADLPRVTVVAACYNHERFVEACLESIAQQGYPNLELIITDDASNDSSPELIERWLHDTKTPATFVRHQRNQGLPATLNEVRSLATGEYISVIATDDLMEPERLHRQIELFETWPESVAALYSDANVIDEDGVLQDGTLGARTWWFDEPPVGKIFGQLIQLNFIPAPSVLVRRSCLEATGPYDEELLFEDWDMWLRLADRFEFGYSPFIGVRYRLVETSMYHSRRKHLAESKVMMLKKWLGHPDSHEAVVARLRNEVHHLYEMDRKAALPHLRMLCTLRPGWKPWLRYLLARSGMSYAFQRSLFTRRGNTSADG